MGEQGWSANNANSFIELPHPYITVASNISRIEAVFVSESDRSVMKLSIHLAAPIKSFQTVE